jgi:hypothetical protein
LYERGLADARAAFAKGGSPESLAPVREAIAALDAIARGRPGAAEIARLTLHAAAAAAQSERDEMTVYIEQAIRMELLQREAGQPGPPGVSALEVAGDLWLQLYGYEEARRAYLRAAEHLGMTPRIAAALERLAARSSP